MIKERISSKIYPFKVWKCDGNIWWENRLKLWHSISKQVKTLKNYIKNGKKIKIRKIQITWENSRKIRNKKIKKDFRNTVTG